jgi:hypothetical protein
MIRSWALGLAVMLAVASSAPARSDLAPGNYVVVSSPIATLEQGQYLIKVADSDGKDVVEVLDPAGVTVEKVTVANCKVLIVFKESGRSRSFDGSVSKNNPKLIRGSFGDDQRFTRGLLRPTESEKLGPGDRLKAVRLPEPMAQAEQLLRKPQVLRFKLREAGQAERKELTKQIEEAQKEADERTPVLYREVIEKHADSPAVIDAALALLARPGKDVKAEEAAHWLKTLDTAAEPYGQRYSLDVTARALQALANQKGLEKVGLETADRALAALKETTPAQQVQVLKAVLAIHEKAGKPDLAQSIAARLARLEDALDREYLAQVPPFKPQPFAGRKSPSERVAVMELFTGAQCPPCVAADVAFDALQKAYKPTDLILIQYHLHIPGPDPLTNADSEARWNYYGDLRGTPSTLFNGKKAAGGGGPMARAEVKFTQYKNIIDELLEKPATVKLGGSATARGDRISIKIEVADIPEASEKLRLRLLLVEESIRYTGGNSLRFHHQVVRAMPGGVDGLALNDRNATKSATKTAEVDLGEVRKTLTQYLDNYAKTRAFPRPDRPLALKHLRIIALVQDDTSKEILQAVQLEVLDGK